MRPTTLTVDLPEKADRSTSSPTVAALSAAIHEQHDGVPPDYQRISLTMGAGGRNTIGEQLEPSRPLLDVTEALRADGSIQLRCDR